MSIPEQTMRNLELTMSVLEKSMSKMELTMSVLETMRDLERNMSK